MIKTDNPVTIKFKVITLFPDLISHYLQDAIIAKAVQLNVLFVELINLRDFSDNPYKSVDDMPYGGGDGMLIRADILEKALLSIKKEKQTVIYLSPQGKLFSSTQGDNFIQNGEHEIVLICGRYAGIDQRFIDTYVDQEISIGDYVLSGGELPALVVIEAVTRLIPGVLGNRTSAVEDSFKDGLLEAPQYTRPQIWNEQRVPDILLSGNHQKITEWKQKMALEVTLKKRPELLHRKT